MANGFEHIGARVGFLKVGGTPGCFGLSPSSGIIMGGDENEGSRSTIGLEPLSQLNARHAIELHVQNETVEPRLLFIRQKRFGGGIGDRLKAGGPQQPAKGLAHAFIVIDDGDISLFGANHLKVVCMVGRRAKNRLLSFGEGRSILRENICFEREPGEFRHGWHT